MFRRCRFVEKCYLLLTVAEKLEYLCETKRISRLTVICTQ